MGPDANINTTGLKTKVIYTVATLPTAATSQGEIRWVSDSDASHLTNSGKVVTGSGTITTRVRSDGTNWRVYGL